MFDCLQMLKLVLCPCVYTSLPLILQIKKIDHLKENSNWDLIAFPEFMLPSYLISKPLLQLEPPG